MFNFNLKWKLNRAKVIVSCILYLSALPQARVLMRATCNKWKCHVIFVYVQSDSIGDSDASAASSGGKWELT